jgi:hypothetical protein
MSVLLPGDFECTGRQVIYKVSASHARIERAICTSYRCLTWDMHIVCAQPGKLPKPLAWPCLYHLCRLVARVFRPSCHHVAHAVHALDAREDHMSLQYPRALHISWADQKHSARHTGVLLKGDYQLCMCKASYCESSLQHKHAKQMPGQQWRIRT